MAATAFLLVDRRDFLVPMLEVPGVWCAGFYLANLWWYDRPPDTAPSRVA
jgi:hypothetical protein